MMSSQALNNPLQQTFTFLSVSHVPCSRAFRWNKKTRRVCSWVVLFCPGHCYALVNPIFFFFRIWKVSFLWEWTFEKKNRVFWAHFKMNIFPFKLARSMNYSYLNLTLKTSTEPESKTHRIAVLLYLCAKVFNSWVQSIVNLNINTI